MINARQYAERARRQMGSPVRASLDAVTHLKRYRYTFVFEFQLKREGSLINRDLADVLCMRKRGKVKREHASILLPHTLERHSLHRVYGCGQAVQLRSPSRTTGDFCQNFAEPRSGFSQIASGRSFYRFQLL